MNTLLIEKIRRYVSENIGQFHVARLTNLSRLKLIDILKRKNPYLFRAKNMDTAEKIVRNIVDAYLSSGEETIFGDWLEGLAIYISSEVYGGYKSSAKGIDLEFNRDGTHYLVSIKSGPNWGNSRQYEGLKKDFASAAKILRTSRHEEHIVAVNGCCYGRDRSPDKGGYFKYCGQDFWYFISGEPELYTEIIEPLSTKAKERNEEFGANYAAKINLFVSEFLRLFCSEDGSINWAEIVRMNSGSSSVRS